ncbi:hypothetical protein ACOSQ4_023782 [Xanthoceras sorbifolium]
MDPEEIARRCAKISLSEEDGPVAKMDKKAEEVGRKQISLSLVGKIVSNREVNREAFKATISSIWRTTKGVEVEAVGVNIFVFRFQCHWDRKRVLEGGPWSFDKQLLILKEVCGVGRVADTDFSLVPFWIQLYNLPLVCMNKEAGIYLGGLIGEVQEIDSGGSGDCLGKFIRVRVLIDINKPLRRGLRVAMGENDELVSVLLCYERLPNFCYFCGLVGHLIRDCLLNDKGLMDDSNLKFGQWLRAPSMDRNRGRGNRNFNSTSDSENSKETTPKVTEDSQGEKKRQEEVSVGTTSDTQGKIFFEDIEPMVDSTLPVGKPVQQNSGNVIAFFQEREPAAGVPPKSIEESHSDLQSSKVDSTGTILPEASSSFQPCAETEETEVCSPKLKIWKRMSGRKEGRGSQQNENCSLGKRLLFTDVEEVQEAKKAKYSEDSIQDVSAERLDRFLCCLGWRNLFPDARVTHLDHGGSDHKPILLDKMSRSNSSRGSKRWGSRFHFEAAWVNEDECRGLVEKTWLPDTISDIHMIELSGIFSEV